LVFPGIDSRDLVVAYFRAHPPHGDLFDSVSPYSWQSLAGTATSLGGEDCNTSSTPQDPSPDQTS
jgi:hypothetical protein